MSAVPNVVAPSEEFSKWEATEGKPNLDIKAKKVSGPKSYSLSDSRRRIRDSYMIKWKRRVDVPTTEEEEVVENATVLMRGKASDPNGWDLVEPDLDFTADMVLNQVDKPVEAGKMPTADDIWRWTMNLVEAWPSEKVPKVLDRMVKKGLFPRSIKETIEAYLKALEQNPDYLRYHKELAKILSQLRVPTPKEKPPDSDTPALGKDLEKKIQKEASSEADKEKKEPGKKEAAPAKARKPTADPASTEKKMMDMLKYGGRPKRDDGLVSNWGQAEFIKPSLTKKPEIRTMRFKAGDTGSFRDISRLLTDGMAFRDMRRNPKGTVLIDCSGSMRPDPDLIAEIVMRSSAVTVALYGGSTYTHGHIVIVGKNGLIHEDIPKLVRNHFNGSNLIDGPALKWLNTQAGPRIWVSDGHVTGLGDSPGGNLHVERDYLCHIGNIERVPSLKEAVPFFKSRR